MPADLIKKSVLIIIISSQGFSFHSFYSFNVRSRFIEGKENEQSPQSGHFFPQIRALFPIFEEGPPLPPSSYAPVLALHCYSVIVEIT